MGEGGFRSLHLPAARCCAAALLRSYFLTRPLTKLVPARRAYNVLLLPARCLPARFGPPRAAWGAGRGALFPR